ncbi:Protein sip5 [Penicillium taxi]|uniref:Protein sip5 n=1 Tax=Penicillium taxi TaxID=168475 RepID=UPI00254538F6|nr:Protein sip5 [Penicillium taxi]KAJ5902409.1 Protein sip5 [Penicillium taxi]
MGNSQTKETRYGSPRRGDGQWSSGPSDSTGRTLYQGSSRSGRSSRPDLSILGIGSSHERDVAALEHRRESKQEREARRAEKERSARIKERERSMKEEHVDGGYLVTQGVYVGTEDFNKPIVRQLMIERRIAPFWRGLNDFSESWAEHQLMAAARGMTIPPPDEIPPELEYTPPKATDIKESVEATNIQHLTVSITSRSQSLTSNASQSSNPGKSLPSASPIASTSISPLFRTRAKTLAALSSSKQGAPADVGPREIQLRKDPFVNGQPIEVHLYKDSTECPICFLYYPPYLNRTRCCDQPICSECFVQIKRPDPHPPEHGDSNSNTPAPEAEQQVGLDSSEAQFVSEPSSCPFCVQPEFGVTYAPPNFRRGLTYATDPSIRPSITSPVSSTSSLSSANLAPSRGRRRATSLSASDPTVVTTDRVRPDWAQKLANARSHAARRSAAATALHTAAYLMNTGSSNDSRVRRGLRRATHGDAGRTGSPAHNALAFVAERTRGGEADSAEESGLAPPRESSRRTRIDELEEMMMMEAIRLSLASEEERQKREIKEVKKEAKKREKDAKKVDKVVAKTDIRSNNDNTSALSFPVEPSSSNLNVNCEENSVTEGKGKAVDRPSPISSLEPTQPGSSPSQEDQPTIDYLGMDLSRPSHLRNLPSASSSFSSIMETTPDERTGQIGSDGSNTSLEPMFNFRSLAEVIDNEEKPQESEHIEDPHAEGSSATPSVHQPTAEITQAESTTVVSQAGAESEVLPKEPETRSAEIQNTVNTETAS